MDVFFVYHWLHWMKKAHVFYFIDQMEYKFEDVHSVGEKQYIDVAYQTCIKSIYANTFFACSDMHWNCPSLIMHTAKYFSAH